MGISVAEKFTRNSCAFAGTGIGMPIYAGNIFFMKFSHSRIPGKCWINNNEISVASCGSHPCIQLLY